MKVSELLAYLESKHVPADSFSLNGGMPNEAYCIDREGGQWAVYYSERGLRTGLISFSSEEEACDHFVSLLKRDNLINR